MSGKTLLPIGRNLSYGFLHYPLSSLRLKKTYELIRERNILAREKALVKERSKSGWSYLDYGDTPAYKGVFEDALAVVSEVQHGFNFTGGLHHASPRRSAGFCVFNDIAVAISYLLKECGVERVLHVDIDAHYGDGVFYGFYSDPRVWIIDIHQLPLYPGTGFEWERGSGEAEGTKLNIILKPKSGDKELLDGIEKALTFGRKAKPQIIFLQAGADGIKDDPLTQLEYSLEGHLEAVKKIHELTEEVCEGKLVVLGGGGYNIENVSKACANIADFLTT